MSAWFDIGSVLIGIILLFEETKDLPENATQAPRGRAAAEWSQRPLTDPRID